MSLLIMSSPAPSSRGLSPLWAPWTRRSSKSKSPAPEGIKSSPASLLVPKPTAGSSESDESRSLRSIRSTSSRGRKMFRELGNRLRSSSSVSIENGPLQEKQFEQVEGWKSGFDLYNKYVTNQISRDREPLQAQFAKITKTLTKNCGGNFVHGLPEALFDVALLWCPAERMHRNDDSSAPSWSWTDWNGAVNFPFDPISCPEIRATSGDYFRSEIPSFQVGPGSAPYTIRQYKNKELRIGYHPHFGPPRGDKPPSDESNTLRFKPFTIPANDFILEQIKTDDDKEIPCSELLCNYKGEQRQCGVIMDYEDLLSKPVDTPSSFEFILLSRNRRCEPVAHTKRPAATTAHPPGTPVWDGERFVWNTQIVEYDEDVFQDGPNPEWNMLNIMLIQRYEDGYAERVAVGRIHEEAWKVRGPVKKDIVLR